LQREQALRDNEERTRFALAAARMGVSGYAGAAVRHVLLVEGTPFLQKPFTAEALRTAVSAVLSKPSTASA